VAGDRRTFAQSSAQAHSGGFGAADRLRLAVPGDRPAHVRDAARSPSARHTRRAAGSNASPGTRTRATRSTGTPPATCTCPPRRARPPRWPPAPGSTTA
jgi:hypothetical protein